MTTGTDMRPDKGAYEAPEVLDKVAATLAKFGEGEEDSTPEPESVKPAEPAKPTPEPKPAESEPAGDDVSTPAPEPKPAEPETKPEPKETEKPVIPDNYYRAAIHQGWTAEQISKLYEGDPDGTLKFLEKTYNDVNNLSQQFAQLGRKARELQSQPPIQPQPQIASESKGLDVKKFKEMYEDDPAGAIVMALEAMQQRPQPQPQPQQVQQPTVQSQKDEWQERLAAVEQLNNFFGSDDVKSFKDFYGDSKSVDWSGLTPGQYANRQAIVNRADEILSGAEFLGRDMTVREAVELAHMEITAPMLQQIVRQDLIKQVQKKSKGATLRPSGSKSKVSPKEGGSLSDGQVIANAEARLADLRGRGM